MYRDDRDRNERRRYTLRDEMNAVAAYVRENRFPNNNCYARTKALGGGEVEEESVREGGEREIETGGYNRLADLSRTVSFVLQNRRVIMIVRTLWVIYPVLLTDLWYTRFF